MLKVNKQNKCDSLGNTRLKRTLLRLLSERNLNMTNMLKATSGGFGNPGMRLNTDFRFSTLIRYADYLGVTLVELMEAYDKEDF